jgi:hypothetical protein
MDHVGILKRALKLTWRNRALWVFGILLALTSGGGGGGGGNGNMTFPANREFELPHQMPNVDAILAMLAGAVVLLLLVGIVMIIVSAIVRYLSENALIKMVNQHEEVGDTGTVSEGFRKGWSRPAFHMFVIDLVIGIPVVIAALLLIAFGLSPLLLLLIESTGVRVLAIVLTVGLMLLVIGILILAGIVLNLLTRLAYREVALGNKRIFEAIGDAYRLIRRNLSDVGMIWLLMLAVGIGWGLLMIPVFLIVLVLAGVIGGIPAAIVYAITESIGWTAAVGAPIGLLTLIVPLTFLSGLYTVFVSSVWTLTYRELMAKEAGLGGESESEGLLTDGVAEIDTE